MKFINPIFNTSKVRQFLSDLIVDYDYKKFSDLTEDEKCQFAGLLIEAGGRDAECECITELEDFSDIIYFLKAALIHGTPRNNDNLTDILKEKVIDYYHDTMEAIFDDVFNTYTQAQNEWLDYSVKYGDPDDSYEIFRNSL